MPFALRLDRTSKVISTITVAILFLIALAAQSIVVGGISLALLLLSWAYSPGRYVLSGRLLTVKRLIGDVRIPLEDIRELRNATGDDLSGCIRLWGSGGLFGYYGLFRTTKLGKSTWYVTDRSKCVVMVTAEKTVVLSPEDAEGFLTAMRATVAIPAGPSVEPSFQTLDGARRIGLAGVAVAVLALAMAAAAMFYAPGAPAYTLTADSLTIHDKFYPVTLSATSIDVSGARVVNIDTDTEWHPTRRTNGFGSLHYHAGWFRVANGQTVRMYRADARRLVLLPPRGTGAPVLYEAKNPEQFVEQLRRQWAGHS